MFIVARLTSRSAVALSVSIGYARTGCGRGAATRSRSPDEDECRALPPSSSRVFPPFRPARPFSFFLGVYSLHLFSSDVRPLNCRTGFSL